MAERILQFELDIERYLPYLFSLLFVLGFLQLLDALRVVYYPLLHRATRIVRFELGVSLVWPLLLLLGLWVAWVMMERDFRLLLFPVSALVAFPFLGLEASISIASIQAVVAGVWFNKDYGGFISGVLLLLCGVEGLALLHWMVFVPLGWASPLEGVADVEAGLFYLAAYLVPLLILPLLFMWVLKPLVRWGLGRKVSVARVRSGVDICSMVSTAAHFLACVGCSRLSLSVRVLCEFLWQIARLKVLATAVTIRMGGRVEIHKESWVDEAGSRRFQLV